MLDVDWLGLGLPLSYMVILLGSLYTFSTIYRKRKAARAANLAPWFPPHLQRNVYLSLLHLDPQGQHPKVPESMLRAALLRRAVEDIHRIIQIRTAKQSCSTLLQRGSVGDDLWQRFQRAEKEMEEELRDVVMEANALGPNWGQIIFQSANEIASNTILRQRLDDIQAQADAERSWWESRRRMAERPEESNEARSSTPIPPDMAPVAKSSASEEDGVLVDASTEPSPTTHTTTTPVGLKKKKSKK